MSIFRQVGGAQGNRRRRSSATPHNEFPQGNAEIAEKWPFHSVGSSPPLTWYSIAILTATPFSTCL
ncbi:MAG TPA: hypothetical protein VF795_09530, partial [Desulfuromonadaceae bacterium]